jgi:hypothetical protein
MPYFFLGPFQNLSTVYSLLTVCLSIHMLSLWVSFFFFFLWWYWGLKQGLTLTPWILYTKPQPFLL